MDPEDVAALFAAISVCTKVWLINEAVKIAYLDGEGQSTEPDPDVMSQKLRSVLGQDAAAIHWDLTRKTLEAATGVPTVVGLRTHVAARVATFD